MLRRTAAEREAARLAFLKYALSAEFALPLDRIVGDTEEELRASAYRALAGHRLDREERDDAR